jgi:hypothetical protein
VGIETLSKRNMLKVKYKPLENSSHPVLAKKVYVTKNNREVLSFQK